MQKIEIIESKNAKELLEKIQNYLSSGWRLNGGLYCLDGVLVQSVFIEEDENRPAEDSEWKENTGTIPVDRNVQVHYKIKNGAISTARSGNLFWGLGCGEHTITHWKLA